MDGVPIKINSQDRELLRTYGRMEDYEGEDDLQNAFNAESDALQKMTDEEIMAKQEKEDKEQQKYATDKRMRNPESQLEKFLIKRMKATCAETRAVSNKCQSSNVSTFHRSKQMLDSKAVNLKSAR